MRSNIDLTLNRDFRKRNRNLSKVRHLFLLKGNYPWTTSKSASSESINDLVFTGTKEDRIYKKKGKEYMNGISCECCGGDFLKKPWEDDKSRLCYPCQDRLKKNINKIQDDLILWRI